MSTNQSKRISFPQPIKYHVGHVNFFFALLHDSVRLSSARVYALQSYWFMTALHLSLSIINVQFLKKERG